MAPRWPKIIPRWPQMAEDGPRCSPFRTKNRHAPKYAENPKKHRKTHENSLIFRVRWLGFNIKIQVWGRSWARMPPRWLKIPRRCPKIAPRWAKKGPRCPKMEPRSGKMAQDCAKMGQVVANMASWCALGVNLDRHPGRIRRNAGAIVGHKYRCAYGGACSLSPFNMELHNHYGPRPLCLSRTPLRRAALAGVCPLVCSRSLPR